METTSQNNRNNPIRKTIKPAYNLTGGGEHQKMNKKCKPNLAGNNLSWLI